MAEIEDLKGLVNSLMLQNKTLVDSLQAVMKYTSGNGQKEGFQLEKVESQKRFSGVHFEKFDETVENWDSYIERFSSFLDIQGISEENRGKALISSISPKLYSLLKSLISPAAPTEKTFSELVATLKAHLNPKPLIIPSRHAFLNRKQHEGESVNTFLAELRMLAVNCCYPESMLNTMLRDVFVGGLRSKSMLDRLFEEDDATLDRTIQIAMALEKASIGSNEIFHNKNFPVNLVKAEHSNGSFKETKPVKEDAFRNDNFHCFRCGSKDHSAKSCKHRETTCNFCKRRGHLQKCCFKAKKSKKQSNSSQHISRLQFENPTVQETIPIYHLGKTRSSMKSIRVNGTKHQKTQHNEDCLSRLPLKSEELEVVNDISVFQLTQLETLPILAKDLAKATKLDKELGPLYRTLLVGGEVKGKEAAYTLESGCILYGQRVYVPQCYQSQVLEELHAGHVGIVKMKAIARSHVYWKNIDRDIEEMARRCGDCVEYKANPRKVKVHYWEYPCKPWERIHIDFAGPFVGHMFLLIVDAHSKWLEVYPMKTANSSKAIECLRECFGRFGLPIVLVSDNAPQLTSSEFEHFLRINGIKHKTCAPFNPASNGQAERYVSTVKQAFRAMQGYPGNLQQKLATFLIQYRKAPNCTTQQSPSMLFLKREIRTRIDLLKPDLKLEVEDKLHRDVFYFNDRSFSVGDRVAVRDYTSANAKWKFGRVVNKDGVLHYTVDVDGRLLRRHVNQMRS